MPTRGKSTSIPAGLESPSIAGAIPPNRRALIKGHGISVYCDRQRPYNSPDHADTVAKVLIALGPACCRVTWRDPSGDELSRTIADGEMVLLAPGIRHAKRWLNEAGIIILYLSNEWLSQFPRSNFEGVIVESIRNWSLRDPLIWSLTNEIRRACIPHQDENRAQALALGNCLAARLVRSLERGETVAQPIVRRLNPEAMRRVDKFIEARLAEKISVKAVARQAHLSASHFGTLFKATTGTSCLQYILQFRVARAKDLLATGAYSIGEVAHMTGFSDHSHLTAVFSRRLGAPPRAFLPPDRIV